MFGWHRKGIEGNIEKEMECCREYFRTQLDSSTQKEGANAMVMAVRSSLNDVSIGAATYASSAEFYKMRMNKAAAAGNETSCAMFRILWSIFYCWDKLESPGFAKIMTDSIYLIGSYADTEHFELLDKSIKLKL